MNKVLFLDRDGVINVDTGYVYEIDKFVFMPRIFELCNYFIEKKFKIIIVTNQSGIGRGYYDLRAFFKINDWMIKQFQNQGIEILDVFFCPHTPEENCDCRKPKSKLFNLAIQKYDIDTNNSWMIGDKESDIVAAKNVKISNTILITNRNEISIEVSHRVKKISEIFSLL